METKRLVGGVSLIEMLLVLIIAMGILLLSLRQYQIYRNDAEAEAIKSNVDVLFQAMADLFRAHCKDTLQQNYSIPIPVNLYALQQGYLKQNLIPSTWVDDTKYQYNQGYFMQFNPASGGTPWKGVPVNTPTNAYPNPNTATNTLTGYAQVWSIQVSVVIKDQTKLAAYKSYLAADCASTLDPALGDVVMRCSTAPASGNTLLTWERSPSSPGSRAGSPYWPSMPQLKRFNQMYSTYPILVLTGGSTYANQQYYVCGN